MAQDGQREDQKGRVEELGQGIGCEGGWKSQRLDCIVENERFPFVELPNDRPSESTTEFAI